ncbi:MAG TPA: hypothetical protein DEA55_02245, partial [Rhodospirillaceae bacterium]|nr:hypothetical protein [Rhodospirillaceae bacterium]
MSVAREIKHRLEAVLIIGVLKALGVMPVDAASAAGGKVMRMIGPRMRRHKRALENIARFLPQLTEVERQNLALEMWENAGRVFGEIPHSKRILDDPARFRYVGLEEAVKGVPENSGGVALSGHCGNWELSPAPSYKMQKPQLSFYRSV